MLSGKKLLWIWASLSIGVLAAVVALIYLLDAVFCTMGERGQFGDQFGILNAIFSGLAFVAVAVSILYQRQQLAEERVRHAEESRDAEIARKDAEVDLKEERRLRKEEADATRRTMEAQREEFRKTAEAQKKSVEVQALAAVLHVQAELMHAHREIAIQLRAEASEIDVRLRKPDSHLVLEGLSKAKQRRNDLLDSARKYQEKASNREAEVEVWTSTLYQHIAAERVSASSQQRPDADPAPAGQ